MNTDTIIILGTLAAIAVAIYVTRKRKKRGSSTSPGKVVDYPPAPPVQPPVPPAPDPDPVLLDRHGNKPGDEGYDPRVDRPRDEFSPVEPHGSYYGEGPFDPAGRWVGKDGVHNP